MVGRSLSTNGAIYATPSLSIVHRYQITSPSAARMPNNPASAATSTSPSRSRRTALLSSWFGSV